MGLVCLLFGVRLTPRAASGVVHNLLIFDVQPVAILPLNFPGHTDFSFGIHCFCDL